MVEALHDCDVLVVGGGIAAALTAIRTSELGVDVMLVDKASFGRSGCSALASGIIGSWTPDVADARWIRARGGNRANQRLGLQAARLSYDLLMKMDGWGVKLVKHDGAIVPMPGTHGVPRAMLAEGGPQMMAALRRETLRRGVTVVNRVMVTDLLTSDGAHPTGGAVVGALGLNVRTGELAVFRARSTVMCTGPYHIPYPTTPVFQGMPIDLSGDGHAAMIRVGAVMSRMSGGGNAMTPLEFFNAPGLEMFTSLGCRIVNSRGENVIEKHHPEVGGSYRVGLAHIAAKEVKETGSPVFLDVRHFSLADLQLLRNVIPIIMGNFESAGYNLTRDLVPYMSVMVGGAGTGGAGVRIDAQGGTSSDGLFAAGNCSDGAYIASSMALAECAATGWWAGESAARRALALKKESPPSVHEAQVLTLTSSLLAPLQQGQVLPYKTIHAHTERVLLDLGVFLDESKLVRALAAVRELREQADHMAATDLRELVKAVGLRNYLQVLEVVLAVIRHRTESRGNILRTDYPFTDNERWLTWTMAQALPEGSLRIWDEEIPEHAFVREPKRSKVLHPLYREAAPSSPAARG